MGNSRCSSLKAAGNRQSQHSKDIEKLADYMKSDKCKNVVLMLGAGVSTSAGIPDFRSPKTGLYSNLSRLKLPHPEAVFEIGFFRRNPVPFYTLAAELYPGSFRPTPTHSFVKLLSTHNVLHTCFTQNIDTLERRAGISAEKIVEAHGSFATQRCIDCRTPFDDDEMRDIVLGERAPGQEVGIPRCKEEQCGGLVKPDIVFFGEALPDRFIEKIPAVGQADLLIIIGTSLTVHPFASLAGMVDGSCLRVLINLERVGDIGRRPSDIILLGECDAIVRELCAALGWAEELERAWAETAMTTPRMVVEAKGKSEGKEKRGKEEGVLEKEINKITDAIEKQLDLAEGSKQGSTKAEPSATVEGKKPYDMELSSEEASGSKV